MDAAIAARLQPGGRVVHGINVLLWALEQLPPVASVKARFLSFIRVGDTAALHVKRSDEVRIDAEVIVDGATAISVRAKPGSAPEVGPSGAGAPVPDEPADLAFPEMAGMSGTLAAAGSPLAALSGLVGMVCPGLHSIFTGLDIVFTDAPGPIAWRVTKTDERFRLVTIAVHGGGLEGEITALARLAPPTFTDADARTLVEPSEFVGQTALVIGASRGIGAATAALLRAGAAKVTATSLSGGSGTIRHDVLYDRLDDTVGDLTDITHCYYFATPRIFGRKGYDPERLSAFLAIYVEAFAEHVAQLPGRAFFYPSSVAVAERPEGMTEYAMAKAAGEILCADLPERIKVERLPRILTDQTAVVPPVPAADPAVVMLPILRALA